MQRLFVQLQIYAIQYQKLVGYLFTGINIK